MVTRIIFGICLLGAGSAARQVWAEKDAALQPQRLADAKTVVQETFDGRQLPKKWLVQKGEWQPQEKVLVGWEKKEDMHAAVLLLAQPFKNGAIRFSFNRDGVTGFNLSLNHARGHLFRILINEDGLIINKDRDKRDPASRPQTLARVDGPLPTGQWHTLLVEIVDETVVVRCDNGLVVEARDPALAVEKTGYRFVMRGSRLLLDDITVWQANP
jgi:hypothetical protein